MRCRAVPFGVGKSHVRITSTPRCCSRMVSRRSLLRYAGGTTPVGWLGKPVRTVTSCPWSTQWRASSETRAEGAPISGGKYWLTYKMRMVVRLPVKGKYIIVPHHAYISSI